MPELRELIAQRLIGDASHPWVDRVVETGAATVDLAMPPFGEMPFVVVRQVQTTVDLDGATTETFEVWIHAAAISFAALDGLERLAITLLGGALLTDGDSDPPRVFSMDYAGTLLGDQIIDPWDAYARGLRFSSVTGGGGALGGPEAHDDPRAVHLRSLGKGLFGCYAEDWCLKFEVTADDPPTEDCPLVWISPLTGPEFVTDPPSTYWMTWHSERLAIHVIAPSTAARDLWVNRLALALPRVVTGPEGDTWFLTLISSDYDADAQTVGQIVVEVRFATLGCAWREPLPPLREVVAATAEPAVVITPPLSDTNPRPEPILPSSPGGSA